MRLFVISEADRYNTVLYLKHLSLDLERAGHFLWGTGRADFDPELPIEETLDRFGPFDGILVVGFKRKPFLESLGNIKLAKSLILDDYYPTKRFIRDANKILDRDHYDLIFAQTIPELENLIRQKRPEKFKYLPMSVNLDYFNRSPKSRDIDVVGLWGQNPRYYPTREAIRNLINELGRNGLNTFCDHVFYRQYSATLTRSKIFVNGAVKYGNIQSRFHEVAASKCLMISEPNRDLEFQGFIDRENVVLFTKLGELKDLILYYLKNEKERQEIVNRSFDLIRTRHSNEIRIREIEKTMEAI